MQDNDPKHTSKKAKKLYEQQGINWWPTPASSTDVNPIERVWRELKYYIDRHVKPLSKKELVKGICLFVLWYFLMQRRKQPIKSSATAVNLW